MRNIVNEGVQNKNKLLFQCHCWAIHTFSFLWVPLFPVRELYFLIQCCTHARVATLQWHTLLTAHLPLIDGEIWTGWREREKTDIEGEETDRERGDGGRKDTKCAGESCIWAHACVGLHPCCLPSLSFPPSSTRGQSSHRGVHNMHIATEAQ